MQGWIPVVSWSLYFWKSVFSFRADSILKSDGDIILNRKFPDCVHFSGARAKQAVIETIAFVYEHKKRTQEMCFPIGHNHTKHFLCPIRSWYPLEFLEMVWWESVPRGSSAHTWNLSSRLFSRPDWLPLGLRGCCSPWLGTIRQSIFCAQSGAGNRLTVWKWSAESRYLGALPPMLENFRHAF